MYQIDLRVGKKVFSLQISPQDSRNTLLARIAQLQPLRSVSTGKVEQKLLASLEKFVRKQAAKMEKVRENLQGFKNNQKELFDSTRCSAAVGREKKQNSEAQNQVNENCKAVIGIRPTKNNPARMVSVNNKSDQAPCSELQKDLRKNYQNCGKKQMKINYQFNQTPQIKLQDMLLRRYNGQPSRNYVYNVQMDLKTNQTPLVRLEKLSGSQSVQTINCRPYEYKFNYTQKLPQRNSENIHNKFFQQRRVSQTQQKVLYNFLSTQDNQGGDKLLRNYCSKSKETLDEGKKEGGYNPIERLSQLIQKSKRLSQESSGFCPQLTKKLQKQPRRGLAENRSVGRIKHRHNSQSKYTHMRY